MLEGRGCVRRLFVPFLMNFFLLFNQTDDLKDFLSMVQHDRKFFLPDTAHVFKQSVMKMDKFSAYKALMGFEAISQYANNLFRKPWRKEYRCVKVILWKDDTLRILVNVILSY